MRIGIDLGGTKTEIIAMDNKGRELYRHREATPRGAYTPIVRKIASLVLDAEEKLEQKGTVGVGIPGTISAKTGKVKNANTTELNGQAFGADLSELLTRDIRVMNDANCLAVSEAVDGAGAGKEVVFAAILGTGCGGGIAFNGKPWLGVNSVGGEWGHNPLPWAEGDEVPGPSCWCGLPGCLETWISGTGFAADYARHETGGDKKLGGFDIVAISREGDKGAQQTLRRYAHRLARALSGVVNLLDPDVIVLGGGMSNVKELYDMVPPLMKDYVFGRECDTPVLKNVHGDSSGVRGAAWLWPSAQQAAKMD